MTSPSLLVLIPAISSIIITGLNFLLQRKGLSCFDYIQAEKEWEGRERIFRC